jgi:hypothetical protein
MKPKKTRLSLDLAAGAAKQLRAVQRKSQSNTFVEAFRKAISYYEMLLDHQASGGKVILENPDGTKERVRVG